MCDLNGTIERRLKTLRSMGLLSGKPQRFFTTQTQLRGEDVDHSNDETRFFIIGYSSSRVLFVVFAERLGNVIRIISARPPTPSERKLYEEHER